MTLLREIKPEDRPICPHCGTPLAWCKNVTCNEEIFAWDYTCKCIDTGRLKPDSTYNAC